MIAQLAEVPFDAASRQQPAMCYYSGEDIIGQVNFASKYFFHNCIPCTSALQAG
jgi:hypothetical protein